MEVLIVVATFDVLPSDLIFEETMKSYHEEEQKDERLANVGFESNSMILNMGSLFFILLILLTLPCCLFVSKPCKKYSGKFSAKHVSLTKSLYGNIYIRYLLEGCLDIAVCIVLNLINASNEGSLKWDSSFDVTNNIFLIVLLILISAFPVWILVFYCIKFSRWENEDF